VLVVVITPPEIVKVLGASVKVWPVDDVTTTPRIVLFGPVMILLTVPIEVPLLLFTVIPVFRPVSVLLETAPRARTLLLLA